MRNIRKTMLKKSRNTTTSKTDQTELKVNFTENPLPKEYIKSKVEPDFNDYTIRNGICPRCHSGKIIERISSYQVVNHSSDAR
jgi:hypothetical protein